MVKREASPNFNSKTKDATPTTIGVHAKHHVLHMTYCVQYMYNSRAQSYLLTIDALSLSNQISPTFE